MGNHLSSYTLPRQTLVDLLTGTLCLQAKLLERQVSETHRGDDTDVGGGTTWVLQLSCLWLEDDTTWDEATGLGKSEAYSALALLNWQ